MKYGFVAVVAAMVLAPVAVSAAHTFSDVPDTHIFHDDIAWMADNGITSGCTPTEYCPGDNVTRGQMAKFLRNVAENKVVDAATAETADHAATADSATNASQLGGKSSSQYQPALFGFGHEDSLAVTANGTFDAVEASVTTAPGGLCIVGQSPQADILVRASGYTVGIDDTETATFLVADNGTNVADTTRVVEDSDGTFAMEWLFSGDGGTETYTLRASEGGGDLYSVFEPQITVEVLQDTRCEGPIVIFPLGDGVTDSPDVTNG